MDPGEKLCVMDNVNGGGGDRVEEGEISRQGVLIENDINERFM